MSKVNEQTKILEEEVVVNENEATELVEVEADVKKAKLVKTAKKVGKIAGIAGIGILGYILGTKVGKKSAYNDSEIDVEVYDVESSTEE